MKTEKKQSGKGAIIKSVDKRLDEQYMNKGYFQDKLDKANEILKKAPLPVKPKQ